ncbi:hypothetical protein, variant 1 [Aphanomyces invadans]|uniref:Centrosomal protein of 70 kDa n=2 Tax=Aphanomyces invadans TaxID=157072 RepID=A0A024UFR4_9STRA|nr:hypothetical protein, variant 1 [Aphanomyces invadans]ETW05035.1 hypothetical protein, variant 1 [Aphanomyces invadans]|eukprot:XP_008866472.1 hypothetical protein, variant 1 [Aphanomyces invadans]
MAVKSACEYEEDIHKLKMQLHDAKNALFRAQQQLNRRLTHMPAGVPSFNHHNSPTHNFVEDDVQSQFQMCFDEIKTETAGSAAHVLNKTTCRLESLQRTVIASQRHMSQTITELRMECHELREAAKQMPSRREIKLYQLQIEALQMEVEEQKKSIKHRIVIPEKSGPRNANLTQDIPAMMRQDKLLRQLRVVKGAAEGESPCIMLATDNDLNELPNGLRQRAGYICMDMVAEFCISFDVENVMDLHRHIKHIRRLSRSIPALIQFVERMETLAAAAESASTAMSRAKGPASGSSLDTLHDRLSFLIHDYIALHHHLVPPGRTIHLVLTSCMHVLNVTHVDDIAPTIVDLIAVTAAHREFASALRHLLGLSDDASRSDILDLLGHYLNTIGLGRLQLTKQEE